VRALAALAIGLLGDQACDPSDAFARNGRLTVRSLWTPIERSWPSDDMPVALLTALSMQPREGVPGAVLDGLRDACLKGRLGKGSVGFLARAHAALALARLGDGESTGLFLGIARARRHDVVLRRSCVVALAVLGDRLESSMRTLAAEGLAEVVRSGDPDTAGLALASIGRLLHSDFADGSASVANKTGAGDVLLDAVERGSAALRPFGALAAAIACRAHGRCADVPAWVALRARVIEAVRGPAGDEGESPDTRGAFCLALGLLQDDRGVGTLVAIAREDGGNPTLRADACAALGLLGVPTQEALAVLRSTLETRGSDDLRREAARSLGILGDVSAVPLLVREITSGAADHVLGRAALALGEIGDASAVPPLTTLARDARTAGSARAVVLAALGLVGDLEPTPSLSRLGVDSNYLARTDALYEALSLL
jgi:HEAT repeat protein